MINSGSEVELQVVRVCQLVCGAIELDPAKLFE